jgi:hypothetical protein
MKLRLLMPVLVAAPMLLTLHAAEPILDFL